MNVGCQSPWGGVLASGGTSWDWGVFLGGIPHVQFLFAWEEFENLPVSLHSFTLSFVLTLPEILSCHLRKRIPGGRRAFFCSWKPRLFTLMPVNLLKNSPSFTPYHCIVQNFIKVAPENHTDLILSSRRCLGSPQELMQVQAFQGRITLAFKVSGTLGALFYQCGGFGSWRW